jgi:hypothetical protein
MFNNAISNDQNVKLVIPASRSKAKAQANQQIRAWPGIQKYRFYKHVKSEQLQTPMNNHGFTPVVS